MLPKMLNWAHIGGSRSHSDGAEHRAVPGHAQHGHTHGVVDPGIVASAEGIRAVKWSFAILIVTAVLQLAAVLVTHSVALLADTIHNFADATTAIPLWAAFVLGRRRSTRTFTYGFGRVEDLAGLFIVLIVLLSAVASGYEATVRLFAPQPIFYLPVVATAGIVGFLGNTAAAIIRIRVGHKINSTALVADGYHAAIDGLTSLAVVMGAVGTHLGMPLADPIIGLLITLVILGIVWQSARIVITRLLDGVEPGIVHEIEHAAEHVPRLVQIRQIKARWLGHELHADIMISVDENLTLAEATEVAASLRQAMQVHLPALSVANVQFASTS